MPSRAVRTKVYVSTNIDLSADNLMHRRGRLIGEELSVSASHKKDVWICLWHVLSVHPYSESHEQTLGSKMK